jgi:predicted transporter
LGVVCGFLLSVLCIVLGLPINTINTMIATHRSLPELIILDFMAIGLFIYLRRKWRVNKSSPTAELAR